MIPKLEDYKILYMHHRYFVLNPYDLFSMPAMTLFISSFDNPYLAQQYLDEMFRQDYREYERLKARGRDFPDND